MVFGSSGLRAGENRKYASGTEKESPTGEGDSPVREAEDREPEPEYRGTREILWEAGGTTPQA